MNARLFRRHLLIGAALLLHASLWASPLTWFPGPTLSGPRSAGATTIYSGANLLIGGDSSEVQWLAATNLYWTYGVFFYGALNGQGAVARGGDIIVYGGADSSGASYNTATDYSTSDNPTAVASMSVARSFLGYAPDSSGNAYALGGLDAGGKPLASAEYFSLDANKWTTIAAMPQARYNFPAVFDGTNRIYIFGGRTNSTAGTETPTVYRYSTVSNKWTAVASMPIATAGSAAALTPDGKIYVVGGLHKGSPTNVVQVYNIAANTWTVSTPLPEGLTASSLGVDALGRLVVMGGMDINGNDVADVWRSQELTSPDTVPVLTQYPATAATYLATYASSIAATGNPQPVYELVAGPAGMTVDQYTGAITWTPSGLAQIGPISVTIAATNYAGATNFTFTINVPNPPPSAPTGLTATVLSENSVSLSWAPEAPTVGATTYTLAIPHPYHSPRGSGGGINYQIIASGITGTNIIISGLTPSTTFTYNLKASAPGGTSGWAGISFTTVGVQVPTNLQVIAVTPTTISLAWSPPLGPVPAVSYIVSDWYNFGYTGISTTYGRGITNTYFKIAGLAPGSAHSIAVQSVDAEGYASGLAFFPAGGSGYIVNPVPPAQHLSSAVPAPGTPVGNSPFQFIGSAGSAGITVNIQATTNPSDPNSWIQIGSVTSTGSPFTFTDANSALYPMRYYRVVGTNGP